MRKYHKQRLLKLADYLEGLQQKRQALPDQSEVKLGWHFGFVVANGQSDTFGHLCQTAGCALGHLPEVYPKQIKAHIDWTGYEPELTLLYKNVYSAPFEFAEYFFGLTLQEAWLLFDYGGDNADAARALGLPHRLGIDALPIQVAENIRAFVALK